MISWQTAANWPYVEAPFPFYLVFYDRGSDGVRRGQLTVGRDGGHQTLPRPRRLVWNLVLTAIAVVLKTLLKLRDILCAFIQNKTFAFVYFSCLFASESVVIAVGIEKPIIIKN